MKRLLCRAERQMVALAREAYFLTFAEQIAKSANAPVMTTGGIRRLEVANHVLNSGIDLWVWRAHWLLNRIYPIRGKKTPNMRALFRL